MYIFFKRTVPYPMLMTFDAPDSTVSCSRRERTNTPLQALTLLNDPVFYECAQTLGRRIYIQHTDHLPAALDDIFLNCLGRKPTTQERAVLAAAYRDVLRLLENEQPTKRSDEPKVAALIAVARMVMNLDEFVTRN